MSALEVSTGPGLAHGPSSAGKVRIRAEFGPGSNHSNHKLYRISSGKYFSRKEKANRTADMD
jgi:hypothetical protein